MTYRPDGSFRSRLLLRIIGSKVLSCSAEGPGIRKEEEGSTSSESSVMPSIVEALRAA